MRVPETTSPRRRPPRWLILLLLVAALEVSYVFIISAGTFTTWSTWNANYDKQAEGFRAGHLYISTPPSVELLARRNPYDWSNQRLWFWDASLYKNHYYLYWGPLPALVLAGIKGLLRINVEVGDQYLLFGAYTLYLVAGALLIDRMARRLFPALPLSLVAVGIATFACASPTPYMIATPGIYEAAIASAQAFLLLGLVLAFDAVWMARDRPPSSRSLIAAGIAWALAIACRANAALAVLVLVPLTAALASRPQPGRWRQIILSLVWAGAPIGAGVFALLAYNKARFDAWFEFGLKYQLNTIPLRTSRAYLLLDVFSYLLRPLGISCRFPFVSALYDIGAQGFPGGVKLPPGYSTHEPLAGLLLTTPSTWFGAVGLFLVTRGALRRCRAGEGRAPLDDRQRASLWCVASFAALGTLMFLPSIAAYATTMRYLSDVSSGLVLLALWGGFSLVCLPVRSWSRGAALWILLALAGATMVLGLLLGFQGYDEMFKNHNPAVYTRLATALSFCRGR
jgi:hypothetical protein